MVSTRRIGKDGLEFGLGWIFYDDGHVFDRVLVTEHTSRLVYSCARYRYVFHRSVSWRDGGANRWSGDRVGAATGTSSDRLRSSLVISVGYVQWCREIVVPRIR